MSNVGFSFNLAWILLSLLCFVGCNKDEAKNDQSEEITKIYRLVIDRFYVEKDDQAIVINQFSLGSQGFHVLSIFIPPKVDRGTLEDYERKNRISKNISADFPLNSGFIFVSHSADSREDQTAGYRRFRNFIKRVKKNFPNSGGIIGLSQIGFNKKMNQAVVRFRIIRWSGWNIDRLVLLEKKETSFSQIWTLDEISLGEGIHSD